VNLSALWLRSCIIGSFRNYRERSSSNHNSQWQGARLSRATRGHRDRFGRGSARSCHRGSAAGRSESGACRPANLPTALASPQPGTPRQCSSLIERATALPELFEITLQREHIARDRRREETGPSGDEFHPVAAKLSVRTPPPSASNASWHACKRYLGTRGIRVMPVMETDVAGEPLNDASVADRSCRLRRPRAAAHGSRRSHSEPSDLCYTEQPNAHHKGKRHDRQMYHQYLLPPSRTASPENPPSLRRLKHHSIRRKAIRL
jgi:hypothetical protein